MVCVSFPSAAREDDDVVAEDSDPAVKQLLVNMDEKQSFIIQDLDDNHLLIKADEEDRVRRELEAEVRININAPSMGAPGGFLLTFSRGGRC